MLVSELITPDAPDTKVPPAEVVVVDDGPGGGFHRAGASHPRGKDLPAENPRGGDGPVGRR